MLPKSALKWVRREVHTDRHLPYSHFNNPAVIELHDGGLLALVAINGVPFVTALADQINAAQHQWHQAIMLLGEGFCMTTYRHRQPFKMPIFDGVEGDFLLAVDQRYQSQFVRQQFYLSRYWIAIVYRGRGKAGQLSWLKYFTAADKNKNLKEISRYRQQSMLIFETAIRRFINALSSFDPRRIGLNDADLQGCEMLTKLSVLLNLGISLNVQYVSSSSLAQPTYPRGAISQYLSFKRLSFGRSIQWGEPPAARYAAMVSVKRYGGDSSALMFDSLLNLDDEMVATHRFKMIDKHAAQQKIQRQLSKLINVSDKGHSQLDALSQLQDDIACDRVMLGEHFHTVMVIKDDLNELESAVDRVISAYLAVGYLAVRESIGQEVSFWAQFPGNYRYIPRASWVTSQNFCDYTPLHTHRMGYSDANHLGQSIALLKTAANTPFYFNLHLPGRADNPSAGHSLIVGGNGSGKTVMMCFLDAQLSRYKGSSIFFDRNRGMETYVRACGGTYTRLAPSESGCLRFNIFSLQDNAMNRAFCRRWLLHIVSMPRESINDEAVSAINEMVDYAFTYLPPEQRCLSTAVKRLPINFPCWSRLQRYLQASADHVEGEYAYLFDHVEDDLNFSSKVGFDFTHFLDHEDSQVLVSLMLYVLHRIEQQMDGRLVSIFMDEGWQYLENPYWQSYLKKWLPTLRKLNAHVILATQSPYSLLQSPIAHVFLDNVATQIFFPNPQAKADDYIKGFNLSPVEYDFIHKAESCRRLFLYKQGHHSSILQLDLSSLDDYLKVFSANQASLRKMDQLMKQYGSDPQQWLLPFCQE